jgi:hypothetical protein
MVDVMDQDLGLAPAVAGQRPNEGMSRTLSGRDSREAAQDALRIKRRFKAVSDRFFRPSRPFAFYRWVAVMTVTTFCVALLVSLTIRFGSPLEAARHLAAMPNCATAAMVGVPRPVAGEPGYWPWLDEDRDGNACEPYLKAS